MDSEDVQEGTSVCAESEDQRADLGEVEYSDRVSWSGEAVGEMGNSVEILTRLELDLACASEKIVNLNVLMMHVATRESDFEAFALKRETAPDVSLERALEFDFLSGVLDSEVRELDGLMDVLRNEVANARELVSSCSHEDGTFKEMEEKLRDSEQSFGQSQDQISGIRTQSATLQRALMRFNGEEIWNNNKRLEEDQFFNMSPNIKIPTVEQQRHVLRMLEKSLAREIDLEKKVAELRQVEEELKQKLLASEREVHGSEDEIADISDLKEKTSKAEFRAENAEVKCRTLTETISELNKELTLLKSNDKVESLERQLKECDRQLQCAIASAEAGQEKQNLLYSTIEDMENLIDDLKMKVVKHELRADSTEEKCIVLSESNAELNEELSFLRGRLEALEASLQQADETKISAAKGIDLHARAVKDLIVQLAIERNRLNKQISSLATGNKRPVQKLQENNIDLSKHGSFTASCSGEFREEVAETSPISSKLVKTQENVTRCETEVMTMPGPETVRRIDAEVLSFKDVLSVILILVISVGAYYFFQLESCPV